jgi:nucleoside-diphosphate-sugar epimerase
MTSKRYLVTGSAGFIGSNLVKTLCENGNSVVGIDSFHSYYSRAIKERNLIELAKQAEFEFKELDILDLETSDIDSDFDCIFHLAAQPGVRDSWGLGFDSYAKNNVLGTQKVFEFAARRNIQRVVFSSSSSIYGDAETFPTLESANPQPRSPYGVSKLTGEYLGAAYSRNFGLDVVALRYFTVYGPGQRPDMAIHRLINCAITGTKFPKFGTGEQIRDFTFVKDVVSANILASSALLPTPSIAVNVGGGNSTSLNLLISTIESISGRRIQIDQSDVPLGDVIRTGADTSRARELLGWHPQTGIEAGLKLQFEWQLENS